MGAYSIPSETGLLMVDADDIKQINTRFGHLTGDFVLAEIAAILKDSELFAQTANFELL